MIRFFKIYASYSVLLSFGLFFVAGFQTVNAQEKASSNQILYGVFYEYKHVYNLSRPQDTLVDQTLLLLNDQSSRFLSYGKLQYGVSVHKQFETETRMASSDQPFQFRTPQVPRCFAPEHYLFFNTNKHFILNYFGNIYLYEEEFPSISWKFVNQSKQILGISCKLARGYYKGRKWEVWYAEEIPISAGPWELNGLPGLILDAKDETGEIRFSVRSISPFKELEKDEVLQYYSKNYIELPSNHVQKISKKEFNNVKNLAIKDRRSFLSNPQFNYFVNRPMYLSALGNLWLRNSFPNSIAK